MKQIKLINKISKLVCLLACLCSFTVLPIYASSEEGTSDYTGQTLSDLSAVSMASLRAYNYWKSIYYRFYQNGFVNVQDRDAELQRLNGEPFYHGFAKLSSNNTWTWVDGTINQNSNNYIFPTSFMSLTLADSGLISLNIAPHTVYNYIFWTNAVWHEENNIYTIRGFINFNIPRPLTYSVGRFRDPAGIGCYYCIDIANDTDDTVPVFLGLDGNEDFMLSENDRPWFNPIYCGNRNYIPRDLYDLFFPTSPEVDAINYKADRIMEQIQAENDNLEDILSYLHQMNVINGSTNDMVEQLLDYVPDQLYEANESLQDISDTVQQTQDYLEDELDPVSAITEAEDGTNESYDLADEFVDEILPFNPMEVFAPLERFLSIQETGAVVLPIPLFPDLSWTLDLEKFFHYNLATRSALAIMRWILRYSVAKRAMNYVCNRLFILVGLEELQNIIDDMLPL